MSDSTLEDRVEELLAKQEIREVLCRYCRGLDRMDKEMAYSVWHDDGTALYYDMFEGSGHGFVDWVWQAHAPMERHSHQIANSLINIQGDKASSETYITVTLWTNPDAEGKQQEIIGRGRYLDRWYKRDGKWAIDQRTHILDMQTLHELNRGDINAASKRDQSDISFQFIPKA